MTVLLMNGVAAAQDTGGVEISRIDLDAFPEVGFDVAVAANLIDGSVDAAGRDAVREWSTHRRSTSPRFRPTGSRSSC